MRIVAGAFGGRVLKTVEGSGYRPAMSRVREALFSMLESRGVVWSASTVLDLFAGSGSLSFEAVSRGAECAQLVECSAPAVKCLRANALRLGLDDTRLRVVQDDVAKVIARKCPRPFDVIFIDPPYGKNLLPPTVRAVLRNGWLAGEGMLTAEIESALPFDAEKAFAGLELLTERTFGQTRILVWTPRTSA